MAHRLAPGGARPGAGRKKGSRNKRTLEYVQRAEASGIMPRDVMMEEMRFWYGEYQRLMHSRPRGADARERRHIAAASALTRAREAARDAAPYFHARLSATRISGDPNLPLAIRIEDLSTTQIDALISRIEQSLGLAPALAAAGAEGGETEAPVRGDATLQ